MAFERSSHGGEESLAASTPTEEVARGKARKVGADSFGHLVDVRIGLPRNVRADSVASLNQILADALTLRDLYKKHHWQTSGPTFYELHLLFDKHYDEQAELADAIGERIQTLGGTSLAMGADASEITSIMRPPREQEAPAQQLSRLADAHQRVLYTARGAARRAADLGDDGTNDLLVSDVVRTNEKQAWFIAQLMTVGNSNGRGH
jgi:starvation-inducible DNA-binding protein